MSKFHTVLRKHTSNLYNSDKLTQVTALHHTGQGLLIDLITGYALKCTPIPSCIYVAFLNLQFFVEIWGKEGTKGTVKTFKH